MPLFISEAEVRELLPMDRALKSVEASLRAQHAGHAINRERQRILLPHTSMHYLAAALPEEKLMGLKIYTASRQAVRFLVLLYETEHGELLAVIEADHLGRIRTGAASGVATNYMARQDASRVGVIGTGRQARTQLEAVAQVRKLSAVRVFGRKEEMRRAFCREMAECLKIEVEPAESAEAAVKFGDIVITATNSTHPVLHGEGLRPGTHVNAVGANMATRRELDDTALARAGLIAVDSIEQAKVEAGDLIQGLKSLQRDWNGIVQLSEIVGRAQSGRRSDDEITVFKSCGIAVWDVASAGYVYRRAVETGKGKRSDFPKFHATR